MIFKYRFSAGFNFVLISPGQGTQLILQTVLAQLRTIHMRLKKIFEAAGYLKKQNKVHSSYLQKVKVLEKTLDNCVRRWINDERVRLELS